MNGTAWRKWQPNNNIELKYSLRNKPAGATSQPLCTVEANFLKKKIDCWTPVYSGPPSPIGYITAVNWFIWEIYNNKVLSLAVSPGPTASVARLLTGYTADYWLSAKLPILPEKFNTAGREEVEPRPYCSQKQLHICQCWRFVSWSHTWEGAHV